MSQTLFSTTNYPLSKLIEDIELGEIALPDIQRPFVWKATKVRDLFDSMYKGFPIGYLLFWQYKSSTSGRQIGTGDKKHVPRLLVVDGQQRLTSLYAVIKDRPVINDSYDKVEIDISFRPADATFEVATAASRRNPEYIDDISDLWAPNTDLFEFVHRFLQRLEEHREVESAKRKRIQKSIQRLYAITSYQFTAMELNENVDEEEVAEVFVRVNSKGESLKQADFILTLMSVFWEDGRRELETFSREARQPSKSGASSYNHFIEPEPSQLLRVAVGLGFNRARLKYAYAILRGKDLKTGNVSEERRTGQFEQLQDAQEAVTNVQYWYDYFQALTRAGFRSGAMITSDMNLIYGYLMYLIGRTRYGLQGHDLREVIARWFFMCNISGRYTGSSESTMEGDLSRISDAETGADFIGTLDHITQNTLTEDFWSITLPEELDSKSYYSPTLFAYHAALNILDAKALFSTLKLSDLFDPSVQANKSTVERHHLFPKNYLETQNISGEKNQIANRAYVEWADNIQIADTAPETYFPRYASRFNEDELRQMMYWHALPRGWHQMDYQTFLEKRRQRIAQVTRDGFETLTENVASYG